jgi:MYXO-CTERM domain-containing protein
MNYSARCSGIPFFSLTFAALVLTLVCRTAAATVTEPNGLVVPATVNNGEITLQTYFTTTAKENINAVANASITPATFMPLCDFQATLVLSQSGNTMSGLAWYNVPDAATDPNHTQVPANVYQIGTFPMTLGTVVNSSDIRSNTNYAGGLVGFALLENYNGGITPVYYSEDTRNVYCSGCTGAGMMPDYWKLMLSYASTVTANEYYMAWEDWPGATSTSWPDDGDFNDKVFAITGVTCDGGGIPCTDTGMQGVCSTGVTQCVVGSTPTCVPTIKPSPEKCDNLDNDCNGMVDDGTGLCPGNQVCSNGQCVDPCSDTEFPCGPILVCVNGLCVDPGCENVTCNVGQVCHGGVCVGGCDGVVCPTNQICELGVCVDPCAGVTCKLGACVLGTCVQSCSCQPCPSGQTCTSTGACVDTGCDTITCNAGQVCVKGACMDACANAKCPGGASCTNGQCGQPMPPPPPTGTGGNTGSGGDSATGGAGGTIVATGGASGKGGSGAGGTSGGGGTLGLGGTGTTGNGGTGAHEEGVTACNCAAAGPGGTGGVLLLALMALASLVRRRARR